MLFTETPDYSTTYAYDLHGNPTRVTRMGVAVREVIDSVANITHGKHDIMSLSYNGNRLKAVDDTGPDGVHEGAPGFLDGAEEAEEYTWDANGNMTKDLNKGISSITYNFMNLPKVVTYSDGHSTRYTYDTSGRKLRAEYLRSNRVINTPVIGTKA